jgi:hypothetical protein
MAVLRTGNGGFRPIATSHRIKNAGGTREVARRGCTSQFRYSRASASNLSPPPLLPPPPHRNSRGSLRSAGVRIPRKYELLNLDKGSRLGRDVPAPECTCPAIRRPNAGGLPVIKCNLGDCLFTPRDPRKPCNEAPR